MKETTLSIPPSSPRKEFSDRELKYKKYLKMISKPYVEASGYRNPIHLRICYYLLLNVENGTTPIETLTTRDTYKVVCTKNGRAFADIQRSVQSAFAERPHPISNHVMK